MPGISFLEAIQASSCFGQSGRKMKRLVFLIHVRVLIILVWEIIKKWVLFSSLSESMWIVVWKLALFLLLTSANSQLRIVLEMLSTTKSGKFQMKIHIDYDREENKIESILASQSNVIRTLKCMFSVTHLNHRATLSPMRVRDPPTCRFKGIGGLYP